MSQKKDWARVEVMELISCYEQHYCLWNVQSKEYKNKIKKSEAIKQLSEKFFTTTDEINRKLHNLRNQYNTELKKINCKKSGQGSDENYVSKWPFFKSLLFIKTSLQTRQTIGNMSAEVDDVEVVETEIGEGEEVSSQHLQTANAESSTSHLSKKKCEENSSQRFKKMKKTDDREQILATARDALSNDEYDTFGSFAASELRLLRNDLLKRKLKRGIQKLILETSETDEDMTSLLQFSNPLSTSTTEINPSSNSSQYSNSMYTSPNDYTQL